MEIKNIVLQDLNNVVEVHKNSFTDFFLTNLGDEFLYVYYQSLLKDDNALLLGIFDEGKLYGFCATAVLSNGFNLKLIKNNFFEFVKVGIKILFSNPNSIVRLIKNFRKSNPNIKDDGEYAEILSIGVSHHKQGQGFGKKLLIHLESELKLRDCFYLSLTTDYYNNEKTIKFYNGLGYTIYYEFDAFPSRKMYRMIKKLDKEL